MSSINVSDDIVLSYKTCQKKKWPWTPVSSIASYETTLYLDAEKWASETYTQMLLPFVLVKMLSQWGFLEFFNAQSENDCMGDV